MVHRLGHLEFWDITISDQGSGDLGWRVESHSVQPKVQAGERTLQYLGVEVELKTNNRLTVKETFSHSHKMSRHYQKYLFIKFGSIIAIESDG